MKIAIEANRIFRKNKHGMDFVALEMIKQIQKLDKVNTYYIIVSPGEDHCLQESENMKIVELKCPIYPLWEQIALPMFIAKLRPDILHCTSNTAPVLCGVPLILTLHDIIFLEKRSAKNRSLYQNIGFYYRKLIVPLNVKKARHVITVSEYEKECIESYFKLNKTGVILNSYSEYFRPIDDSYEVTKRYIESRDYIFFMGNTDPKKNTLTTLEGYAKYVRESTNPLPLLLANLPQKELDTLIKIGHLEDIAQNIHLSGYIVNSDLPYIYSGAKLFLYTSLRESFGIPILEAMASGTAIITSNNSAIPEIAGAGAILIDPTSVDEIASSIKRVVDDSVFRQQSITYGLERVKLFSWERSAKEQLKKYKEYAR